MPTIINCTGTHNDSFSIGKIDKITVYANDTVPSDTLGTSGDICILKSSNPDIYQNVNNEWVLYGTPATRTISSSGTITLTKPKEIIFTDTSSSSIAITLSSSSTLNGHEVIVKDISSNAQTNNITIDNEGSETIDGSSSYIIDADHGHITMVSDGNNWFIIS